ncbi:hypothetical protein [Streptomyces sp. NBC_01238]|uniref:hypothetical protein n=1 Tax=Streptomyces sp. NBC_01238 TaxID=2903791 RepID=UPI002F906C6E
MTDQPTTPDNRATSDAEADNCCVCGNTPVVYRNYQEQPFCAHCADCACGTVPCTRPVPDQTAAARTVRDREMEQLRDRMAELEQQLADAAGELAEAREHNDRTCEAVARAEQAEAVIDHLADHARAVEAAAVHADEAARMTGVEECRIAHSSRAAGMREAMQIMGAVLEVRDQPQQPTALPTEGSA